MKRQEFLSKGLNEINNALKDAGGLTVFFQAIVEAKKSGLIPEAFVDELIKNTNLEHLL